MARLRKWIIGIGVALLAIGAACLDAFFRGRRDGKATERADEARARIEAARKAGDTDAIDKEWER